LIAAEIERVASAPERKEMEGRKKAIKYFYYRFSTKKVWRAIYPDGRRTIKMIYRKAKDYSKMLGGQIILDV